MLGIGGPLLAALAVAAIIVFAVAAVWLAKDADGVRMAYYCTVAFVAILVGLASLGGLAHAAGEAIANPGGGACDGIRPAAFRAQAPPLPTQEPIQPRIRIPSFQPIPRAPDQQVPSFRFGPVCNTLAGRSRAAAEAIRSGVMLIAVGVLVGAHRRGMQGLVRGVADNGG